jgi:hypothetical protein
VGKDGVAGGRCAGGEMDRWWVRCGCLATIMILWCVDNTYCDCAACMQVVNLAFFPTRASYCCDVYLCFGHYLWLPTGLSDLANHPGVAMIRI